MADAAPKSNKKPKRRLRAVPTLREQTAEVAASSEKPSRIKRILKVCFVPFRLIGRGLQKFGRGIAKSRFGQTVRKIARSRVFAPVRFLWRVLKKILLVDYFKGSWEEIKLVVWPNNKTTWRLTFAVILFAIIFGLVIAGLDWVFERVFREIILDL